MKIRLGSHNDVNKVSRLWLMMVKELAPSYTPNVEWWRSHCHVFLDNAQYSLLVAEDGGKILGFIDFFVFPEPSTGKIHGVGQHIFVHPEYRKTRVAAKLYRAALKTVELCGCESVELFCFDSEKAGWMKKGYEPVRTMVRRRLCTIPSQQQSEQLVQSEISQVAI